MPRVYGERWEYVRDLSGGGQGQTIVVRDKLAGDGQEYVLKRLINTSRIDRFRREAEVLKQIDHPNVVKLIDYRLDGEKPYIVMEYCAGGSLDRAKRPFWHESPLSALRLFLDVCDGLAAAHYRNIIHRDLKPGNVFLRTDAGPAVVGDFGLAFVDDTNGRLTLTGEAVGPRDFIAPELEGGRASEVTSKCDIYSLGKLLYWLMSGGKTLPRERFREERYDLKGRDDDTWPVPGWRDIYMEHVNRLLDLMVQQSPDERRSVSNITILTRHAYQLIEREFAPIRPGLGIRCIVCGSGPYRELRHAPGDVSNFGLSPVAGSDWRLLVCTMCGNVQMFRVDMAQNKHWWTTG